MFFGTCTSPEKANSTSPARTTWHTSADWPRRYLAVELTSGDGHCASLAEIVAYDAQRKSVPRENWAGRYVDSEDLLHGNHTADKAFDLQESTHWSCAQADTSPQWLVIDMGTRQAITSVGLLLPASHADHYRLFVAE